MVHMYVRKDCPFNLTTTYMNIILWILGYLLIGLIIGNIKWKIVFSEYANTGKWYKNPLFWFFFPWRCLNAFSLEEFQHMHFKYSKSIREDASILSDMDLKPRIVRSITMDTFFWILLVVYNVLSLLFIALSYSIFHICTKLGFPIFKFITKPIRKFFCWFTFDLFGNKQVAK